MKNKSLVKQGFTLAEILIAVLIIGVLASIASPLYRNAVDKSRWARLISPAHSIANAEEAIMISNGYYTVNKDELVVSLPTDSDLNYTLYTVANGDAANLVRVESSKLEDVRLARYYQGNSDDSENVYCEAQQDNDRAKKICSKVLKGTEVSITDDGYKTYLIEGRRSEVCNWWSNTDNTCYSSEQERCEAHGMTYANSTCGCVGTGGETCLRVVINEGGKCEGQTANTCRVVTINAGGVCEGQGESACGGRPIINANGECNALNRFACGQALLYGGVCNAKAGSDDGCYNADIYTGGTCNAIGGTYACRGATIRTGGVCNGETKNGCSNVTIFSGGICNGNVKNSCNGIAYPNTNPGNALFVANGGICNGNASGACSGRVKFESGAVCNGNASGSCGGTFQAGSKCYANEPGSCQGDYSQGGCCVGTHCPSGTNC